jgi:[ribosomal protein S5]-alanine N-acetyltransferase
MNLHTTRLHIRPFTLADAAFVLALLNDPDWLRFIGERNVKSESDAQQYLLNGPIAMLAREGFSLCAVDLRETGATIGMCGLVKRVGLTDVDIGYAFLPAGRGHGYAAESAKAVLTHALDALKLARVVAILNRDNVASCRVLERIGMRLEGEVTLPHASVPLLLYSTSTNASADGGALPA